MTGAIKGLHLSFSTFNLLASWAVLSRMMGLIQDYVCLSRMMGLIQDYVCLSRMMGLVQDSFSWVYCSKVFYIIICVHIYIYMVIDLKVLVRSFNCESRACYVGNPGESFFGVRESKILFRESFAKVGYYNHYM